MTQTIWNQRYNPCKGCKDRYRACQDTCKKPERLAWLEEQKKINENRRNYRAPAWVRPESRVRKWK